MPRWHVPDDHIEYDTAPPHRKLRVTLLANPIRSSSVSVCFTSGVAVCSRAKVVTEPTDGYQGRPPTTTRVQRSVCSYSRRLPWHAGMVPLQVPLLVQVLVTVLCPPVIT